LNGALPLYAVRVAAAKEALRQLIKEDEVLEASDGGSAFRITVTGLATLHAGISAHDARYAQKVLEHAMCDGKQPAAHDEWCSRARNSLPWRTEPWSTLGRQSSVSCQCTGRRGRDRAGLKLHLKQHVISLVIPPDSGSVKLNWQEFFARFLQLDSADAR
jgi:hypothetical protein